MLITIDNVRELQRSESLVHRVRIVEPEKQFRNWLDRIWGNLSSVFLKRSRYRLLKALDIQLRDGRIIHVPDGFEWDLSSVPKLLWGVLPPDGDFELAALIHDFLYINKIMSRERADVEMFAWSKAVAGTTGKKEWSDVDNWVRYAGVRVFGWTVYNKRG